MSQFQEFPKVMSHPAHAPAEWKKLEGEGVGIFTPDTVMTAPERFPPVTVKNKEQEDYYASRGYRPNNNPDPVGYEQALMESQYVPGYENSAYPKWKYSKMEIPVIVKNPQEEDALQGEWFDYPVEATEDDIVMNPDVAVQASAQNQVRIDRRSKAYKDAQKAKA